MSLMPPSIVRDLSLERHGYRVHPMGPYFQAFPEGGSLTIHEDDPARTRSEISRFSRADAEAWGRWNEWLEGLAAHLGPLLTTVPPTVAPTRPRTSPRWPSWYGATVVWTPVSSPTSPG